MHLHPLVIAGSTSLFTPLRTQQGNMHYPTVTADGIVRGRPDMEVSRMQPIDRGRFQLTRLERHPHCSQTFIPLEAGEWLVVVSPNPPDGKLDLPRLAAYAAGSADAVCLHRNTWHATLTVFDRSAEFVMMMWRADSGLDTVYFDLPTPLTLSA